MIGIETNDVPRDAVCYPAIGRAPVKPQFHLDAHQLEGLRWMRRREETDHCGMRGGLLCMTMGLGKTFTTLVHILSAPEGEYPTLVVMSKTLIEEWKQQGVEKFFDDSVKALYLHKDYLGDGIKKLRIKDLKKYDIVLTTYDTCVSVCKKKGYHEDGDGKFTECASKAIALDRGSSKISGPAIIYCVEWNRIVCDESQRFSNPKTLTFKSMMALCGKYRWCLTGTPVRNYDTDIWAQLRFLGYNGVKTSARWKATGFDRMKKDNLGDAILTMSYDDANMVLVPKHYSEIRTELSGNQLRVYDILLKITRDVHDLMMSKLCNWSHVLAMFTRLRQCVIAPYLLTPESKRSGKTAGDTDCAAQEGMEGFEDSELFRWCGDRRGEAGVRSVKMNAIVDILRGIPEGEKTIVFSVFTAALDLVAATIEERLPDRKFVQVDGGVTGCDRSDALNKFRRDASASVLLLTYKVGSEGLNITEANHCILVEPWWTPAVHNQAESRCWRRGQTKDVQVYWPLVANTIEDRIMQLCKKKDEIAAAYLNGTRKSVANSNIDRHTLADILNG